MRDDLEAKLKSLRGLGNPERTARSSVQAVSIEGNLIRPVSRVKHLGSLELGDFRSAKVGS